MLNRIRDHELYEKWLKKPNPIYGKWCLECLSYEELLNTRCTEWTQTYLFPFEQGKYDTVSVNDMVTMIIEDFNADLIEFTHAIHEKHSEIFPSLPPTNLFLVEDIINLSDGRCGSANLKAKRIRKILGKRKVSTKKDKKNEQSTTTPR